MPTGQKLIDWTAENDAKLFLTILAVENVHPNCENVAAAFGGSVNAMAIANRLNRLRRKAADDGLIPKGGAAALAKGRKSTGAGKKGKGGKKDEMVAKNSEGEDPASDHESSDPSLTPKTPAKNQKVLTGRVTKARSFVKKNAKSNDKLFEDVQADAQDNGLGGSGGEDETHDAEDVAAHIKNEEVN